MFSPLFDPTDWRLPITSEQRFSVWQSLQASSPQLTLHGRSRLGQQYLNQICLETVLAWLQTEYWPMAQAWEGLDQRATVWAWMYGSVILVDQVRIALIPTDTIDQSEMLVPQEWVDIPSWVADYYVAVQVLPEADSLFIYGYATHQQIKARSTYDALDRTYCVDAEELTRDLNTLWLAVKQYTAVETRAKVSTMRPLSDQQANRLLQQWQDSAELLPRLSVPFEQWAALLENADWRSRLYQQYSRLVEKTSESSVENQITPVVTQLGDWFDGCIEPIWQAIDTVLSPRPLSGAMRGHHSHRLPIFASEICRVKVYGIAEQQIGLFVGITTLEPTRSWVQFQIYPVQGQNQLLTPVMLRLLDQNSVVISQKSGVTYEMLQLQFRAQIGEQFQVEMTCGEEIFREQFAL